MVEQSKTRRRLIEQRLDDGSCWQFLLAEFIGAMLLTLTATAPVVIGAYSSDITHADKVVSPGLLVMVMIYTVGNLSGAHFNPAVTLAFALRGAFMWSRTPAYWAAQFAGGVAGAAMTMLLFGTQKHIGATLPDAGIAVSLVTEIILTSMLVMVILGTSREHKIAGSNAALAVGATISLCGMIASPISGASMNPARSFGPALLSGSMNSYWIYLVGPCLGSVVAVVLFTLMQGFPNNQEIEAAEGKDQVAT